MQFFMMMSLPHRGIYDLLRLIMDAVDRYARVIIYGQVNELFFSQQSRIYTHPTATYASLKDYMLTFAMRTEWHVLIKIPIGVCRTTINTLQF